MKYTILGILSLAALLLVWVARSGSSADTAIMAVAIISVTFFAALPNLWNSLYRKHAAPAKPPADLSGAITVKLPERGALPATPSASDGPAD